MVDSATVQRYIPLLIFPAAALTVSVQLAGHTLFVSGDTDFVIVLSCILVIAALCFVYARKFNNFPLDFGLALFIFSMSVLLAQKLTVDLSLVQRILLGCIFLLAFASIGLGISRARRLQDERISQLSQQKSELSQLSSDLERANAKLRLLSQVTRHDINNQLTLLRGYLRILEKKHPELSGTDSFQKSIMSAQRISSIIQFTKEYESMGQQAPVWQECRLLAEIAASQVSLGSVLVKNDLPERFEVFADPLIVKVFYNLIDNAVRYGGKITVIRFSLSESGNSCTIICEDDGEGIPEGEKERIFDRGFGKNTGLGLTMSREILSITGIRIRETGEPGKGSRFEILVPDEAYRSSVE